MKSSKNPLNRQDRPDGKELSGATDTLKNGSKNILNDIIH
jgi:hypothetical protein